MCSNGVHPLRSRIRGILRPPHNVSQLLLLLPSYSPNAQLTSSSIANLGYSAANAQAMTVPPYLFASLVTLLSGWAADRYRQRALSVLLPNLLALTGFIIIIASVRYKNLPGVTLFGIFFAIGGLYPVSPAVTAWTALNLAGSMYVLRHRLLLSLVGYTTRAIIALIKKTGNAPSASAP